MPKIKQCDRNKIAFLKQKGDSQMRNKVAHNNY